MRSFLIAVNIALVIAVGVLFYLVLSNNKKNTTTAVKGAEANNKSFKIAYFEMDSIENNFKFYKSVRNDLREKEQQMMKQLNPDKNNYYKKLQEYNESAQNLTPEQRAQYMQELQKLDERYKNKENMLGTEMQEESFRKLQDVKKKIEDYLKDYNKDKGYAFIMASTPDLMYYRDTVYNVTADVINGLNNLHKAN